MTDIDKTFEALSRPSFEEMYNLVKNYAVKEGLVIREITYPNILRELIYRIAPMHSEFFLQYNWTVGEFLQKAAKWREENK